MKVVFVRSLVLCSGLAAAVACSNNSNNPAQPSGSSSGSGSTSSVTSSVVAPRPLSPANASQIRNADQPVVLTITNGVVTGNAAATYTFEVATDQAFSNKVQVKDAVPEGSNGQTSARLDALAAATDYYWHARAQGGGTTGVFSPVYKFTVGPAILIQAPAPFAPASGSTTAGWPTFTVTNAARSGPAGPITYRFEVSTNSAFTAVILTATVAETATVTSYTPPTGTAAPATRTLYWRATAFDQANGVSSPSTPVWSFTYADPTRAAIIAAQEGVVLWPGVQPPGSGGHIVFGDGWGIGNPTSFTGVVHVVPTLEELRVVDLLDRGMDPGAALGWMNSNGYPTSAVWYSGVGSALGVIGFQYEYMAHIDGAWVLVVRSGA